MDSLEELTKTTNGKNNFFKHVFNFDDESKNEMLNIIQYAFLAIIPVVIINKLMQKYVPEADENKHSLELFGELLAQIIVMFIVILIIHRIITFIPTYSGVKYENFHVTNIILAVLVIILSLQTKLGEKVSILVDRVIELWEGKPDTKVKKNNVKVSQPISQNQAGIISTNMMNQNAMNQSLNTMGSTSIHTLPEISSTETSGQHNNNMNAPMQNTFEPMAANSAIGDAFGSAFGGNW